MGEYEYSTIKGAGGMKDSENAEDYGDFELDESTGNGEGGETAPVEGKLENDPSTGPPDVHLDVPSLHIDQISLEVEDLTAHVSLSTEVLDLLKLNVGADVTLGRVHLELSGVEAQAELQVRLGHVAAIVGRVLTSIDRNPQILEQITQGVRATAEEVGSGANKAVGELGRGAGEAVEATGEATGRAVGAAGESAGRALEDVSGSAGNAVDEASESAGNAVETASESAGDAVETASETTGDAVGAASESAGDAVEETSESAQDAVDHAQDTQEVDEGDDISNTEDSEDADQDDGEAKPPVAREPAGRQERPTSRTRRTANRTASHGTTDDTHAPARHKRHRRSAGLAGKPSSEGGRRAPRRG